MLKLKAFFDCGTISKDGHTKQQLPIRAIKDTKNKLFPLLEAYPL